MFFDEMDSNKTDGFHPWLGQFNPLHEEDRATRHARWFREGVIRFEFDEWSMVSEGSGELVWFEYPKKY